MPEGGSRFLTQIIKSDRSAKETDTLITFHDEAGNDDIKDATTIWFTFEMNGICGVFQYKDGLIMPADQIVYQYADQLS